MGKCWLVVYLFNVPVNNFSHVGTKPPLPMTDRQTNTLFLTLVRQLTSSMYSNQSICREW